jgi:HEAT repeat protein
VVPRLREAERRDLLEAVSAHGTDHSVRKLALVQLAELGDPAAQRDLLSGMLEVLVETPTAFEHEGFTWSDKATDLELVPLLEQILRTVRSRNGPNLMQRSAEAALQNIGNEAAVAAYDRFIADPSVPGAQFFWYQREGLVREIARRRVLDRLPNGLSEVAEMVAEMSI